MKPDIADAISALGFKSGFGIKDDKIHGWDLGEIKTGETQPTELEINTKLSELEAEYDAQEYARNRATSYPSIGDQLDMMYKDTKNSTSTHADAVEVVKTKWPKDNSGPV